ncbi:hypothetical protein R84B8_02524 [Treponema sp. R8-4-B8]
MKKLLIVIIVILGINQHIFSQDADVEKSTKKNTEKKWTIQTSPFLMFSDIFIGDINDMLFIVDLEGQCRLSKYSNISITLSFLYNDRTVHDYDWDPVLNQDYYYDYQETYFQIGFKPMYVYRPFGTGIKGFYIGFYPNLGFRYEITGDNKLYTEVGFGLNLGYKWVFDSGFTMQIGGGIGKTFSFPQKTDQDAYINSDGRITILRSDISLDFKLGYSF